MNYLWGGMILVGVVYAAMTGNLGAVTDQALASAKEAVSLCLTMTGAMAFWVGLMKIAEKGGMVNRAHLQWDRYYVFCFRQFRKIPQQPDIWQRIWCPIFWGWAGRQPRQGFLP